MQFVPAGDGSNFEIVSPDPNFEAPSEWKYALGLTWVGLIGLRTARILFHVKEKGRPEPLVGSPGLTLLVGLLGCAALALGVRPLTVAWGY